MDKTKAKICCKLYEPVLNPLKNWINFSDCVYLRQSCHPHPYTVSVSYKSLFMFLLFLFVSFGFFYVSNFLKYLGDLLA